MKSCVEKWLKEQMPGMDEGTLGEIYAEYGATARKLLEELQAKSAAGEPFAVVDKVAHTLKGNALMVGDNALFEVVQAWRAALKDADAAKCGELMPEIVRMVGEI